MRIHCKSSFFSLISFANTLKPSNLDLFDVRACAKSPINPSLCSQQQHWQQQQQLEKKEGENVSLISLLAFAMDVMMSKYRKRKEREVAWDAHVCNFFNSLHLLLRHWNWSVLGSSINDVTSYFDTCHSCCHKNHCNVILCINQKVQKHQKT